MNGELFRRVPKGRRPVPGTPHGKPLERLAYLNFSFFNNILTC
jgi:hypothetical protein